MLKVLAAAANIFLSVVLAAVLVAYLAVEYPGFIESLQDEAGTVKNWITGTGLDPKYNVWLRFFIAEQQLLFIGFIITVRIVLALMFSVVANLFGYGER